MRKSRPKSPAPSSSSGSSKAGRAALGALKITLSTSKTALEFAPVPGLGAAVDGILSLITAIEKTKSNSDQLTQLALHVEGLSQCLLVPVSSAMKEQRIIPDQLKERIANIAETLIIISKEKEKLLSHGKFKRFFLNQDISDTLAELNVEIKNALDQFMLQGSIELDLVAAEARDGIARVEILVETGGEEHSRQLQLVEEQVHESNALVQSGFSEAQEMTLVHHQEALSRARMELIDSLPHAEARYDAALRNSASGCLEGTRVALLQLVRDWITDDSIDKPRIFWLCGLAGTGKSTVAQTIAEYISSLNSLGATFFFSRDSADCSNALLVFSTIARQLAFANAKFGARIAEALEANRDAGKLVMMAQLQKLIIEPLLLVEDPPPQTMIVIDALDECTDRKLAQDILILFAIEILKLPFQLNIFLTSRSELHIASKFDSPILKPISRPFILHDIEQSIVDADIELYLRQMLQRIADVASMGKTWPDDESIFLLRDRARGLFIFAATVVKFVGDEFVDDPGAQLDVVLEEKMSPDLSPFADIDKLYLQVLVSSLPERGGGKSLIERFQIVVGTIVLLMDPLPLSALEKLIGISDGIANSALKFLHSLIVVPKEPHEPVHIIHPSFHDYLTERCRDERFFLDTSLHHERLAIKCLEVMVSLLKRNICQLDDETKLNQEIEDLKDRRRKFIPEHLAYACAYWGAHISKITKPSASSPLVALIQQFAQFKLLQWLEVVSVQTMVESAFSALASTESWYTIAVDSDDITIAVLRDSQRFILEFFEPIREGAGQIYHSALPLSPPCALTNAYDRETPGDLVLVRGKQLSWGACLRSMHGHTSTAQEISCSPNGRLIISGSFDHTARIWDANTGSCMATLAGHRSYVNSAVFSPDGERVMTASEDYTIRIWEPTTGATFNILKEHQQAIRAGSFSRDGQYIVSAGGDGDNTVRIWDSYTGLVKATANDDRGFIHATFGHSAQIVATTNANGRVCLWNWQESETPDEIHRHGSVAGVVRFSPDGLYIVSSGQDGVAQVMTGKGNIVQTLKCRKGYFTGVVFNPDGLSLWTSDKIMTRWNHLTGEVLATFDPQATSVLTFAVFPDQKRIVIGMKDKSLRIYDIELATRMVRAEGHTQAVTRIAFSNDGRLVATSSYDGTARIWDLATGAAIIALAHTHTTDADVYCLHFDNQGGRLVTGSDKLVYIWEISGLCITTCVGHEASVAAVAFSPSGTQVASGSADQTVRIWDASDGSSLWKFDQIGDFADVRSLSYSPDGGIVISGSADGRIRRWEVDTGTSLGDIEAHADWILSTAWSPDGTLFASSSDDQTIKVWNAKSGELIRTLSGHAAKVSSVSFDSTSSRIISKSFDKTVRFWTVSTTNDALHSEDAPLLSTFVDKEGWLKLYTSDGRVRRLCWLSANQRPWYENVDCFEPVTRTAVIADQSGNVAVVRLVV